MNRLTQILVSWQRINHRAWKKSLVSNVLGKVVLKIFLKVSSSINHFIQHVTFGSFVPYTAHLGTKLFFPHQLFGVFISQNAHVGNGCTIMQHVTIGSDIFEKERFAPKIGNNVFIGVNANIIGKSVIGDNCRIGAGTTIVNETIDSNKIVVGQKFRILN
jgi:serine O-acetyltransferase